MPDGIATFPGIEQIVSAEYTRAHGIQPGQAQLTIAPQSNFVGEYGTLLFEFAGSSNNGTNTFEMPDCKLDIFHFERNTSGQVVRLAVLDRRWKWEFPTISGFYNMRHENGELVTDLSQTQSEQTANLIWNTSKTPQDLARLCLDAMGEQNYDVSDLPNDTYPLVEWEVENAARALEELCEVLGCRVVLRLDNTVKLCKVGQGEDLPENFDIQTRSPGADLPEQPDVIRIVCGRDRYQADMLLEAVGLDVDGQIKPIDELSYIPKDVGIADYTNIIPPYYLGITDLKARLLAKQSLWRWYRVKTPFSIYAFSNSGDPNSDPTPMQVTAKALLHFIPLEDQQVDKYIEFGIEKFKPAWVYGIWGTQTLGYVNGVDTLKIINPDVMVGELQVEIPPEQSEDDYAKRAIYQGGFSIDRDRAIVKFSEVVCLVNDTTDSSGNAEKPIKPAVLILRTALGLRDTNTRQWLRYSKRRELGTEAGTKPRDIKRDEVTLNVSTRYTGSLNASISEAEALTSLPIVGAESNVSTVDQACEYYLDVAQQQYLGNTPEIRTYTGLQQVELDGAIQQVSFSVSRAGTKTTIARNTEILVSRMSYNERRFYARMRRLRETSTTSQQQQGRDARRRAAL